MKRITVLLIGLCVMLLASNAFAYSWTFNGDTNTVSPETAAGLQVGVANFGSAESDIQPILISGAGTTISGQSNLFVSFTSNLYTWDIYKPGGYYDVFAAALSESGYYWELPDTTIHPLESNGNLILAYDSYGPSYWGGQLADNDGILESDSGYVDFNFTGLNPATNYYLSVFLQTNYDEQVPSWGTISNLYAGAANPVPEPASLSLLGLGLLGLLKFRRKRVV